MVPLKWCEKCSNTGLDINNNPCSCRFNVQSFYDSVSCLDIPEQYRGIRFNKSLVAKDMPESYAEFLDKVHTDISTNRWSNHNLCICSPTAKSKTILAYSCMESLFRYGHTTFPVFDVLELKRIMLDLDLCRKSIYVVENPENMFLAPILFIKVPRVVTWEIYDTMVTLLDRRTRRGNSTIFIYDGSWEQLVKMDKQCVLTGLLGDGSYNTIEVKTWYSNSRDGHLPEIQIDDNIG